ncbi:MAG: 3-oxoacyl-ACP reductase FabG [Cyclobacteriaceae bacterium]|nr:3-oxoacyl-ACP reductase FabG [Cyclobacteriaceae bacterium]
MGQLLDFYVKGKTALVTGAARGIGRSCALALAEAGADIALGLRNVKQDNGVSEEIRMLGREVLPLQLDVADTSQIRQAVEKAIEIFGRIDILVNNAGIAPSNLIEDYTEEDFDLTVAVNLKGTYFMSQAVGRHMIRNKSGKIINLSSQAGYIALPSESVYCMTKAGIRHLTRCFAVEWAKYNINVNAVAPTFIETPGTEPWLADPEFKANVLSKIQLGRIGMPQEVSSTVVFLASSAASMITGETILIDGGWTAV